ncbi:hypothetical protein E2C01_082008 [Portunus trituberculatus]|uniref:Uncharacterized protein n=1 Tax=Portunus trituberculatus TaxID=210409 RepID=A0A5B7IXB8_PORTR|nr:hypothetical protein [Portunus trituberculatus]
MRQRGRTGQCRESFTGRPNTGAVGSSDVGGDGGGDGPFKKTPPPLQALSGACRPQTLHRHAAVPSLRRASPPEWQ